MTDRAARKRRERPTETPQKPAENEGCPPAGYPTFAAPPQGLSRPLGVEVNGPLTTLGRLAAAREGVESGAIPTPKAFLHALEGSGDSAPYQLPDGSWEVLTLSETGAVTGRRKVEAPE